MIRIVTNHNLLTVPTTPDIRKPKPSSLKLTCTDSQIDHLFTNNNVGIPVHHAKAIQKVAADNNTVISIRPVNILIRELALKDYPSKGIQVKGKTANWGPQAGFVCEDQHFSKEEAKDFQTIKKLNEEVQIGKQQHYRSIPLSLCLDRIQELSEKSLINITKNNPNQFDITAFSPSNKEYHFCATWKPDGLYQISELSTKKPIMVLAPHHLDKPYIADYDLFFCAPRIEEMGQSSLDSRNNSKDASPLWKIEAIDKRILSLSIEQDTDKEERGYISKRINSILEQINTAINRGEQLDMVHHGDDAGNPKSDIKINFPATVYLPKPLSFIYQRKRMKFQEICVVRNIEELNRLTLCIKDNDYQLLDNSHWRLPRRASFDAARNLFESLR